MDTDIPIIPAKFLCTNCMKELSLVRIVNTGQLEIIGVDICSCKGDPKFAPKSETNILSFNLEKERLKLKKETKK